MFVLFIFTKNISSLQISDYLWSRSVEIEPRSSDTLKRRSCERRWPGLNLKSPGIRPKDLRGKNHPNPLPKIGSRSKEDVSPLASPSFGSPVAVFKQSPASTPVTPSFQTSPRESEAGAGAGRHEADKIPVILPHVPAANTAAALASSSGKPPPLPPKPTPPLPPRDSSPPPPIPPRLAGGHRAGHSASHRSPLESRPPLMDPVFPQQSLPPSLVSGHSSQRHRSVNGSALDHSAQLSPAMSGSPGVTSLSRPPSSLPHSASWLPAAPPPHNGLGPLSAGPEIGSHFTFGAHMHGPGPGSSTVSPQLPPRPTRTTSTPR